MIHRQIHTDNIGFLVIKPDSFMTGIATLILDYFEKAGFLISAYSFKENVTQSELERMHSSFTFQNSNHNFYWWMVSEQSKYAPYLGIVLTTNSKENCLGKLNRLKGDTDPLFYNCIGIRQTMHGINKCMNCIHVPDNFDKMMANLRAFFSDEQIDGLMANLYDNYLLHQHWRNHLEYFLKWYDGKTAHQFIDIVLKSKIDILVTLYKMHNRKLKEYTQFYLNRLAKLEYTMDMFLKDNDRDICAITSIREDICSDGHLNYEDSLQFLNSCQAFQMLSNPQQYSQLSEDDISLLKLSGVKLYPVDWLILKTSMIQWPIS
ncbi:MAG: hypothetical protein HFE44_05775 [Oscillospiraceae bacterium]|nr:hypothetical protein [Oscillospiraceae bacterium]